jgi:hypothetical protein
MTDLGYCSYCGNSLQPEPDEDTGEDTFAADGELYIVLSCGVASSTECDIAIEVPVSHIFGD